MRCDLSWVLCLSNRPVEKKLTRKPSEKSLVSYPREAVFNSSYHGGLLVSLFSISYLQDERRALEGSEP